MVTVILNVYKRKEYFKQQVESIKNQTIPVDIWVDFTPQSKDELSLIDEFPDLKFSIRWNQNLKYHGRFNYALNADTEYIFVCDDDIIPGKDYLKHCIETMEKYGDCLLTTYGVILNPKSNGYNVLSRIGWHSMNDTPKIVDMAGHSWFFKKKHLKYLNYEEPITRDNGEDLHFSYMLKKYAGIPIIVPAHNKNEPDKLGCNPVLGNKFGMDEHSTWKKSNHIPLRNKIVETYRKDGWKLVMEK